MSERASPPPLQSARSSRPKRVAMILALILAVPIATFEMLNIVIGHGLGWRAHAKPGVDMLPGIEAGDWFFVDPKMSGAKSLKRGDIAVFYPPSAVTFGRTGPDGLRFEFAQRVIGLPGDRIEMTPAGPIVNGTQVVQKQLGPFAGKAAPTAKPILLEESLPGGPTYRILKYRPIDRYDRGTFVVPPDSYFVLGDNRDDSVDSRSSIGGQAGWYVPLNDIIGRPTFVYWAGFDHLDRIGMAVK
jgi:signal peptidase I